MHRHPLVQMLAIGAVASAIGVAIVLQLDWFPPQASREAADIDRLYDVSMVLSVPIFVLVMTVALYSVWRFRARPGDHGDGAPIHGSTRLEAIWVTIPFLIVCALGAYSWIVLDDIEAKKPAEMVVNVTGQQFAWTFDYPQPAGGDAIESDQLFLPRDRRVVFKIRSKDVIHSFWVPAFRVKMDAVPGLVTTIRTTPERPGVYSIVCAELCGLGHTTMRQAAHVVSGTEFSAWLAERKRPAAATPGGGADEQGGAVGNANGEQGGAGNPKEAGPGAGDEARSQ